MNNLCIINSQQPMKSVEFCPHGILLWFYRAAQGFKYFFNAGYGEIKPFR